MQAKEEHQKPKSLLEDLMDNQLRTKPRILKKWIRMGKKKNANYNCHTNFKLVKSDAQNGQPNGNQLKSHIPFDQLANGQRVETCRSVPNEANSKINFAKENEPIKEKSARLPSKVGPNKETTSLFNLIFRSLTSSSSNSNPSNPSDNLSMQNSASNEKMSLSPNNRTADKDQREKDPTKSDHKSFDLKDMKINLSLNSLQASPQRLAISIKNLPEN